MTRALVQRFPGELPRETTGFVGRDRELDALAGLLEAARMVTVTGTAGVGKTRVALRAAARAGEGFADGVCFVELGGLRDLDLVPHTVAACLGLPQQDARAAIEGLHQQAEGATQQGLGVKRYDRLFRDGADRELGEIVDLAVRDLDRLPPLSRAQLTKREQEIAALVAESLTNSQIARRLIISSRTVDAHIASIYGKLGISSRVQLVTWLGARSGGPPGDSG